MNSREWSILQKLINNLDDTRLLYMELGPLLAHTRLIYLVGLITLLHEEIAGDLARQMDTLGTQTPHRAGSTLGKLRALLEPLMVNTGADLDLACLKSIARHETRVVQRFGMTLDEVEGLPQWLHREQCRLAHTLFRVESLMQEMGAPALSPARNAPTADSVRFTRRRRS